MGVWAAASTSTGLHVAAVELVDEARAATRARKVPSTDRRGGPRASMTIAGRRERTTRTAARGRRRAAKLLTSALHGSREQHFEAPSDVPRDIEAGESRALRRPAREANALMRRPSIRRSGEPMLSRSAKRARPAGAGRAATVNAAPTSPATALWPGSRRSLRRRGAAGRRPGAAPRAGEQLVSPSAASRTSECPSSSPSRRAETRGSPDLARPGALPGALAPR